MVIERVQADDRTACGAIDDFMTNQERGHYLQLTSWIDSYRRVGFVPNFLIAHTSSGIAGVLGFISSVQRSLRFAICSVGPIVAHGGEAFVPPLLEAFRDWSRERRACAAWIQPPVGLEVSSEFLLPSFLPGPHWTEARLRSALAPQQLLCVELAHRTLEQVRAACTRHTQRNLKIAERSGATVEVVSKPGLLQQSYALIERNGRERGYPVRTWRQFGPTVERQVREGRGVMLAAVHRDEIVSAHYSVIAGQRYNYLLGGSTHNQLRAGYLLHWAAIVEAKRRGLRAYDLTSQSAPGVMRFKLGFSPERIPLVPPIQTVLDPVRFAMLRTALPWLWRFRGSLSKWVRLGH